MRSDLPMFPRGTSIGGIIHYFLLGHLWIQEPKRLVTAIGILERWTTELPDGSIPHISIPIFGIWSQSSKNGDLYGMTERLTMDWPVAFMVPVSICSRIRIWAWWLMEAMWKSIKKGMWVLCPMMAFAVNYVFLLLHASLSN